MNLRERLCHYGPDKSNGQKNDKQYQNTKLLSILQEKRKVETRSFHIMCYVDYNQILKNAGRFEKAHRKSKKTGVYFLFACEYILL